MHVVLKVVCFFIFISGSSLVFSQCPPPDPEAFGEAPSCTPKSFTLNAINSPDSYNWYDSPTDPTPVFQGDFFSTPVLSTTKTYYVTSVDFGAGGCESNRIPVEATILPVATDVSVYGNNQWIAYCFNNTNFALSGYKGFYLDNNLSIQTPALWNSLSSPNDGVTQVSTYDGCPVLADNHSISYKRQGFPPGIYRIDLLDHNDDFTLTLNGSVIMSRVGFGQSYASSWIGALDANSQMEYRWLDNNGKSSATVNIVPVSNPTDLYPGRIQRNQAYCLTGDPSVLEDSVTIKADKNAYVQSNLIPFQAQPAGELKTNNFAPDDILYSYVSFDISSIRQSTFNNAYLYLSTYDLITYPNKSVLISSTDTTWDESTISWLNKPMADPSPITSSVVYDMNQRWYKFDVSNYIQAALTANTKRISLQVRDTTLEDNPLLFYSRSTAFPPMLVINNKRGGCTGYSYQWQESISCNNTWSDIPGAISSTYDPPAGLTDSVCYRLKVTDGCLNTALSNELHVNIDPQTISGTLSAEEINLSEGIITVAGNEGRVVQWEISDDNFASITNTVSSSSSQINYTASSSTNLYYRARVKSGACPSLYSDTLLILKVQEFILFNSFSPNQDGINDVWKINGIERYPDNKVSVVNFMGVPVYEASAYNNESIVWDGTSSGQSLPDGTYYYSVEITGKPLLTGYVILKR